MVKIIKNESGRLILNIDTERLLIKATDYSELIFNKAFIIILVLIVMYLVIKIANKIISKFVEKQIKSNLSFTMNKQKAITVGAILKSTVKYSVYIAAFAIIIGNVFKVSASVLSGIGFVVGIGAQSLVKDLINGFFILFEDQFGVGDYITIGAFSGVVENIGIRTTTIRDFNGNIHIIQNGNINQMTNHSRGDIRFIVDCEILYKEDIEIASKIIKKVCEEFEEDNKENLKGKLDIQGLTDMNYKGIIFRVIGRAKPLKESTLEKSLKVNIKLALYENGIEMPYSGRIRKLDNDI